MNWIFIIVIVLLLFVVELLYFKIATYYDIVDKPNNRSSHTRITIRGGGIIFAISLLICPLFFGLHYLLFLVGLFFIALISFLDDIKPVSSLIRIAFHVLGAVLIVVQLNLLHFPFYYILSAIILIIATINAVNFMDGINGITGIYSFVALCTLYYLNLNIQFTDKNYITVSLISIVVFNFFNCRKKAICFAGDVGSVAIAFIIAFFLIQLIIYTQNLNYVFLLLIYGLDTITTIIFRLMRKEQITEAHRSHFYQYMANEKKYPHLVVAGVYGLTQLLINIAVIKNADFKVPVFMLLLIISTSLFLVLRFFIEGKKRLLVG